ncbi:MAG: glucose-6-phosphate isomerase [Verrucomicrobia bacterium]|nr:glucose-6-phosphate isomerase [Verrucomicrobiota bacterium]
MNYSKQQLWERFKKFYTEFPDLELAIDLSRTGITDEFLKDMEPRMQKAFDAMKALEAGAIANPDEGRMVGHYWLRNPTLAPTADIRSAIETTLARVKAFAADVLSGKIRGAGGVFENMLLIGIGGSALGPQFVGDALGEPGSKSLRTFYFDNTDPDGMQRVLKKLEGQLARTLCLVISKSGGTKETRNGMLEAKAAYCSAGVTFEKHVIAVTGEGSELDQIATKTGWLERFPMWDWVGGRTSELSAVGLLPAALQGIDVDSFLSGAKACDEQTRTSAIHKNPAALLALAWFQATGGLGNKNMVVIPYKDRLGLLSKYLQQLIMESLGKEKDLNGNVVHQGITVLGNKGATDQHSYVQQLRDGLNDFFLTFVEVLVDQRGTPLQVEPEVTSGDYLAGFLLGTRQALFESGRESVCLTVKNVSPFGVGVLIALFERAVGLYATLVNINAYHQPGVEAGKKAASAVLDLQRKVAAHITSNIGRQIDAEQIASEIGAPDDAEHVFKICRRLAENPARKIFCIAEKPVFYSKFYSV